MVDALRGDENCTHLDAEQAQRLTDEQSARPRSVDSTPSRRWYVAQTHVHADQKATFHLGRQGFQVYLPRYTKRRRHARRTTL